MESLPLGQMDTAGTCEPVSGRPSRCTGPGTQQVLGRWSDGEHLRCCLGSPGRWVGVQAAECAADPQARQGWRVLGSSAGRGREGWLRPSCTVGVCSFLVLQALVRTHLADE